MQPSLWIDRVETLFDRAASRINAASTAKLLTCLIGIFFVWRFVMLDFFEKSGDAVWKWSFLRYYANTGVWFPAMPDHHQARWAINLPVLLLMKIFGDSPWVYYIFPLLTALGTGIFLFLIAARLRGKAAGCVVFLIALAFPLTARESTQFLPMLPAAFFALAATWLLLRHIDSGALLPVFCGGILLGVSYGCKLTSLYWAAGFLLALSLWPTERKTYFRIWKFRFGPAVFLFGFGLLTVLILETLLFFRYFGVTGGLPEIILGSHLSHRVRPDYLNAFEYLFSFLRPLDLSGKYFDLVPHILLLVAGTGIAVLWAGSGRKPQRFLATAFLTAYLLHSYVVYKVFPFLHPEKNHARYFLLLAAFALLFCTAGWHDGITWLEKRIPRRWTLAVSGAAVGVFLLLMMIRAGNQWSGGNHVITVWRTHAALKLAGREGVAVLMKVKKPEQALAGNMATADIKYGSMWLTFWGPVELLPRINEHKRLFFDADGKLWQLLLNDGGFRTGNPMRVLLLDEEQSEFKTGTFRPAMILP